MSDTFPLLALLDHPEDMLIGEFAVCLEGRWRAWIFKRNRAGQWISYKKLQVMVQDSGSG